MPTDPTIDWSEIFSSIRNIARRVCRELSYQDRDDIVQLAMLRTWRAHERSSTRGFKTPWLYRHVKLAKIEFLRKWGRLRHDVEWQAEDALRPPEQIARYRSAEFRDTWARVVDEELKRPRLGAATLRLLRLIRNDYGLLYDHDSTHLSVLLRIPVSSVHVTVHRVRERIADRFRQLDYRPMRRPDASN